MRVSRLLIFGVLLSVSLLGCEQARPTMLKSFMSSERALRMTGPSRLELTTVHLIRTKVELPFESVEMFSEDGHWEIYRKLCERYRLGRASRTDIQTLFEYELWLGNYDAAETYYQEGATSDILVDSWEIGEKECSLFRLSKGDSSFYGSMRTSLLARSILFGLDDLRDALLFRFHANPDFYAESTTVTPIWCAIFRNDPESYYALLSVGADKDNTEGNAFMECLYHSKTRALVKDFLMRGYHPDSTIILYIATYERLGPIVQLLLEYGADPDKKVTGWKSPRQLAKDNGYLEIQKIFDTFVAKPEGQGIDDMRTLLNSKRGFPDKAYYSKFLEEKKQMDE